MKGAVICAPLLLVGFVALCASEPAVAADKAAKNGTGSTKPEPKRPPPQDEDTGEGAKVDGKKAKVLTFGAMDVEGKMRTPQLLFFVGRVKAELDSSSQLKRSFIKELKATSKEKGL